MRTLQVTWEQMQLALLRLCTLSCRLMCRRSQLGKNHHHFMEAQAIDPPLWSMIL